MDKYNFFTGITMDYNVVKEYYPVNYKHPYFDHFVFQPMIGDGHLPDDTFTVAAYAADADGEVLNDQNMLATHPLHGQKYKFQATKKHIQFANMHLDLTALGILYPPDGPKTELKVYPTGYYMQNGIETAYVLYYGETADGGDTLAGGRTPINPSPPY